VDKRERVHTKRCNTITFVDDNLFATSSDDANIALWDLRYLQDVSCSTIFYLKRSLLGIYRIDTMPCMCTNMDLAYLYIGCDVFLFKFHVLTFNNYEDKSWI